MTRHQQSKSVGLSQKTSACFSRRTRTESEGGIVVFDASQPSQSWAGLPFTLWSLTSYRDAARSLLNKQLLKWSGHQCSATEYKGALIISGYSIPIIDISI